MARVAIIGAGSLGSALAHALATRDRVPEILLIDEAADVAAGKALDIQQAGAVQNFRARVRAAGDIRAAAGARVIVLADAAAAPNPEWQGEQGLSMLRQIWRLIETDATAILCAGSAQRTLIELGVRELKIDRRRLLGSAPTALASGLSALVALSADGSPADVSLSVLGIPPHDIVVPWAEATIAGANVAAILAPHQISGLDARIRGLWPPGPYTLASAAAQVTEGLVYGSRRRFCCFVALDGEMGARGVVSAAAVLLEVGRIADVQIPSLTVQEQVRLQNALGR